MIALAKSRPLEFCFELDAVDDIADWGDGLDKKLHWFGLTLGHYWISTPIGEALRYSDEKMKEWKSPSSAYVDYQVARLFEDLQLVLPIVLEPVPSDIAALVSEDGWLDRLGERVKELDDTDQRRELSYGAMDWYEQRSIDTMYLVDGPLFHFWRSGDEVHFRWETAGENADRTWRTPQGHFTVSSEQFEAAAYSFFDKVLAEMKKRVQVIEAAGWHRTDSQLNIPLLMKEQQQRAAGIGELRTRQLNTDWKAVRMLVASLSAELSI